MDYNEEVRQVAIETLRKMHGEDHWVFPVAFNIAFRESNFDPDLAHTVRIGVKSFFRHWAEEKRKREAMTLPGTKQTERVLQIR